MNPVEPLDAAMLTAELLSDPLHVAALLILAPPAAAGAAYGCEPSRIGAC